MWSNPVWRYMQWQSYYNSNPSKLTFFFEIMSKMSFLKRLERSYLKKNLYILFINTNFHLPKTNFWIFIPLSFIQPFFHSFIRSFSHSYIRSFIQSFVYSLIHWFIPSFVHSFLHSFVHSFLIFIIHSFILSIIHLFFCLFVHSFVHSWIHSSIHLLYWFIPSIHAFLCLFIYLSPPPLISAARRRPRAGRMHYGASYLLRPL